MFFKLIKNIYKEYDCKDGCKKVTIYHLYDKNKLLSNIVL